MAQSPETLPRLQQEALKDYATEKYFDEPLATRGEMEPWVKQYTKKLVEGNFSRVIEITNDYAKTRGAVSRSR